MWITGLAGHLNASMILASPELVSFLGIEGADLSGATALISSHGEASSSERLTFADGLDRLIDTPPIAANLETRPVLATLINGSLLTEEAFADLRQQPEYLGSLLRVDHSVQDHEQQEPRDLIVGSAAGISIYVPIAS